MARQNIKVPFGYEPDDERQGERGSLFVYDAFDDWPQQDVERVLNAAAERRFVRAVFYPLHDETLRRMGIRAAQPYYRRTERLEEQLADAAGEAAAWVTIDRWEGRRKKYTPMDTALRFLADKYAGPHFIGMTLPVANLAAGFDSFEPWIRKVRFLLLSDAGRTPRPAEPHARLLEWANRWDWI